MSSNQVIEETIEMLNELEADINLPKNIKIKFQKIIKILKEDAELSIKTNKALDELGEIADDPNLEPFTRTQIWNLVSILEKVNR